MDDELVTCERCGRTWDGYAQCFPCNDSDNESSYSEDEEDHELPGNPWYYPGSEDDERHIELRRLNAELIYRLHSYEKTYKTKKQHCVDLMELVDDHKESLGDGKYLNLMNFIQKDIYKKIDKHKPIIIEDNNGNIYIGDNDGVYDE
jgi:hypothetical protein